MTATTARRGSKLSTIFKSTARVGRVHWEVIITPALTMNVSMVLRQSATVDMTMNVIPKDETTYKYIYNVLKINKNKKCFLHLKKSCKNKIIKDAANLCLEM